MKAKAFVLQVVHLSQTRYGNHKVPKRGASHMQQFLTSTSAHPKQGVSKTHLIHRGSV